MRRFQRDKLELDVEVGLRFTLVYLILFSAFVNAESPPLKLVPLSALMVEGLGRTARNLSTASRKLEVSILSIILQCMAPTVLHLKIKSHHLTIDLPIFI
jgi:hypothetical protein